MCCLNPRFQLLISCCFRMVQELAPKHGVAISFRVRAPIFLPQQLQSQMTVLLQLLMHRLPIRFRRPRTVAGSGSWFPNRFASSSASPKPSAIGQPIPALAARSR
jgi:hypothetical protein